MNSIIKEYYPAFEMYQAMRNQLMEIVSNADLAFRPSPHNETLGALCHEIGEVERAYIQSFKTFTLDFSYHNDEPKVEGSVARLSAWFKETDAELRATIESLTDDDIQNRVVDRGGHSLPPQIQLYVYQEALLIFYGKVSVYLKAMGKERPEQWREWIG